MDAELASKVWNRIQEAGDTLNGSVTCRHLAIRRVVTLTLTLLSVSNHIMGALTKT